MPNPLYIRRQSGSGRVDPLLTNQLANNFYYDAIVLYNGGVPDTTTWYGISVNSFKIAINTAFTGLETAGLVSKIKRWTPRIGVTAAVQGINAINPNTYHGVFSPGSTFTSSGTSYDGISGSEDTTFAQQDYNSPTDNGVSFKMFSSNLLNDDVVIGVYDAGVYSMISAHNIPTKFWTFWSAPDWIDSTVHSNGYWSFSHVSGTFSTYKDGVLVNATAFNPAQPLKESSLVVAARKIDNVITQYTEIGLCHEIMHDGLTAQETEDLYNVLNNLDIALGR